MSRAGTIADRIRVILRETGLNQRELSRLSGQSPSFVAAILNGRSKSPEAERLARLARMTNFSVAWVISGEGEPRVAAEAERGDVVREARLADEVAAMTATLGVASSPKPAGANQLAERLAILPSGKAWLHRDTAVRIAQSLQYSDDAIGNVVARYVDDKYQRRPLKWWMGKIHEEETDLSLERYVDEEEAAPLPRPRRRSR